MITHAPARSVLFHSTIASLRATALLLLASATLLPAQQMPMSDGRILQLFDLQQTQHGGDAPLARFHGDNDPRIADVLRHFIEPALGKGDDIRTIGSQWIAVLANDERIASVNRIFEAAKQHRNDLVTIEVHMLNITAENFAKHLQKDLVKVERKGMHTFESVVDQEKAEAFFKKCESMAEDLLAAPTIQVAPLQFASMSLATSVPYVKDFTVQRSKDAVIADPVIATTWHGHKSEVCAMFLPGGHIGLSCSVHIQDLHRPIAELQTTVFPGTAPVTIQLPRTSGVRLANVAEVAPGSLVVLASQRHDGNYLVAIIKATVTGNR